MGKYDCQLVVTIVCGLLVIVPIGILQSNGYQGGQWITTPNCSDIGLWTKCCEGYDSDGVCQGNVTEDFGAIDITVYELQRFATYVFWGALFGLFFPCAGDAGLILLIILAICVLLYPAGAIVSFVSCMLVLGTYENSQLGSSFKCCLAASVVSMIVVLTVLVSMLTRKMYEHCVCNCDCSCCVDTCCRKPVSKKHVSKMNLPSYYVTDKNNHYKANLLSESNSDANKGKEVDADTLKSQNVV